MIQVTVCQTEHGSQRAKELDDCRRAGTLFEHEGKQFYVLLKHLSDGGHHGTRFVLVEAESVRRLVE